MRTVKQLAREFWLPLVIALAWSIYVSWKDFSVATVVTTFAGSFFLASWAIGHGMSLSLLK